MIRPKKVVKTKTRILYSIPFIKMSLYEVMGKNMALPDKLQMSVLSLAF